ncbi:hypothetical protein [Aureliella helgolandensis]|uniref:Uncharacterized protein n=1 Tax=Aureliella helgolandensis TaxID=2527968 RepID=A0A518GEU0_9BACT|nr:hypothetical protein [Aureliella helgolandensis]QDV27116.1 hypothetical protein Q31a_55030 [Aureliella helgolandensis]
MNPRASARVPSEPDQGHRLVRDQASRLRQLAIPSAGPAKRATLHAPVSDTFSVKPKTAKPRCILISELPENRHAIRLAWELAQAAADCDQRALLIDLSPVGSQLPAVLASDQVFASIVPQPLWSDSTTGRELASWESSPQQAIDVIAQPMGPYPTEEQMRKIGHQFVRRLEAAPLAAGASNGPVPWHTVILLTDARTAPRDSIYWQLADDIVLLAPHEDPEDATLLPILSASLPQLPVRQRRLLLRKQPWRVRQLLLPPSHSRRQFKQSKLATTWLATGLLLEQFQITWPDSSPRNSSASWRSKLARRSLANLATQLWNELEETPLKLSFRQAS